MYTLNILLDQAFAFTLLRIERITDKMGNTMGDNVGNISKDNTIWMWCLVTIQVYIKMNCRICEHGDFCPSNFTLYLYARLLYNFLYLLMLDLNSNAMQLCWRCKIKTWKKYTQKIINNYKVCAKYFKNVHLSWWNAFCFFFIDIKDFDFTWLSYPKCFNRRKTTGI